jgi:outer membrane protein TolC
MKILIVKRMAFCFKTFLNFIFLLCSLLCLKCVTAQAKSTNLVTDTSIEERLVQLALQGPEMQKTDHLAKINEYQLKSAQNTWMNLLTFSLNYNEQTLAKTTTQTAYVYPRYFFGLNIPLGTILSRTGVKSARENIEIGKENAEITKRNIREQVLTAYKQYIAYSQLITMQSELMNDVKTQLAQSEEKFRNGTISLDAYNAAQKNNNAEMAALINLKLQQDLKKLELEKMIGVRLETVLKK